MAIYDVFAEINSKIKDENGPKYSPQDVRRMFIVALDNLKYMGYISATR